MVSIQRQPTADTVMDALRQRFLLAVSALRAVLTCIGRVDRYHSLTSICCFVGEVGGKLRPGCIVNRLGQTVVMHHLIDREVFHRDDVKPVDDLAALLMGKIMAPIGNPFVHAAHDLAALPPLRRALRRCRELALRALQVVFVGAQKFWTGRAFSRREGGETQQPHINPHGFSSRRQWLRVHLAGNRDIPFASRPPAYRAGLRDTFQGAMLDDTHGSHLRQLQRAIGQLAPAAILRKGHRIISPIATETRVARFFAGFAAAEERLKSQINPHRHILQDLGMHLAQRWAVGFKLGQSRLLPIVAQRFLSFFPGFLTVSQEVVIEQATFFKLVLQQTRLFFRRFQSELHRFRHNREYSPKQRREQGLFAPIEGARSPLLISPCLKAGDLRMTC